MATTTLYRARRILTMNPSHPEATHVAVREGRVLGVGPLEDLAARIGGRPRDGMG
jgi:predicted amidohydrolase YtcJ